MQHVKDSKATFYTCSCFSTDNIFLEEFKLHVRFLSEHQFRSDYQAVLRNLGCSTDTEFKDILKKIEKEVERRRSLGVKSAERAAAIKEIYKPLHDHVYLLHESYMAPEFKQMVDYCRSDEASKEGLLSLMQTEAAARVFRFPVFKKVFCDELIEEMEHFEQSRSPKGRPNTMNNYGILLNELGFDEGFIIPLREQYLQPLTSLLYHDCGGCYLDSHKAFMVPLSETACTEVEHKVTEGILHRGQHMHGALPISSGQRWNLIVWMRASQERNKLCPMCNKMPTLVEGEGFADGFTSDIGMSLLQNV
ncbi:2-oxoglutarate and iron-dependent oxygenase domain-containing protein 2 isoform X3 [Oncorhynchus mykiss]|uniref:2-oxoglutarate and iron-dependent oxygenase domain-containing protein 2 isoform X3 n=1 Tax=Oncorhynchus mykiss TaxID=8022 RepID=UPI0018780888|nr:2-oxoglutarate and iron-dependent oxygenase domain-containing protein 2 isoform X3 [Oncorhynchus mykiss]